MVCGLPGNADEIGNFARRRWCEAVDRLLDLLLRNRLVARTGLDMPEYDLLSLSSTVERDYEQAVYCARAGEIEGSLLPWPVSLRSEKRVAERRCQRLPSNRRLFWGRENPPLVTPAYE